MQTHQYTLNILQKIKPICMRLIPEKLLFPLKRIHYARTLKVTSENDEIDFKIMKYLIRPGDHVIDIGANIGVYTKFCSDLVGNDGKVFSIEPIPYTFEILCSNVRKLRLENVIPINCAISEKNALLSMKIPSYEKGGRNYYQAKIIDRHIDDDRSGNYVKVNSKTVDCLFSECSRRISFIKCDVEGHELSCIKGAFNIIENSKPAWLIEISGNPDDLDSPAYEAFRTLAKEGYDAFWFDGRRLRRRRLGDKSVNYFFLLFNHLKRLTNIDLTF